MINIQHPFVMPNTNHLQKTLYDRDTIKALAAQIVAAQVEAHLDMISDGGIKEYPTFKDVAICIHGAKETVKDYIADLLTDFRDTLYEEVAKVTVETKSLIIKPTVGDDVTIDADVDVKIE